MARSLIESWYDYGFTRAGVAKSVAMVRAVAVLFRGLRSRCIGLA